MVNVSRKWIKENVEQLSAFGNQITLDNFEEYIVGQKSLQTTLSGAGKEKVESREAKEKFHILIPGVGWADCFGFSNEIQESENDDHSHFYGD
jgi:hypothetical protein